MARVFLDVGAHAGQTLSAALAWPFDRIVCFEPVAALHEPLRLLADERVLVEPFGLWHETTSRPIYNAGTQGGSLWQRPDRPIHQAACDFVRASDWLFSNLRVGDRVWMKVNAEGAELDIVEDLLDTAAIVCVHYLLVMWDARKIPALADRLPVVRSRLNSAFRPPRVVDAANLSAPTHAERINSWLRMTSFDE